MLAPSFAEIKKKIANFIEDKGLFGHNVSFDLNFLKAKGINLQTNTLYDTLELAPIAFPSSGSFSLESLSSQLKLTHPEKHRALADILATYELFQKMIARLALIPKETIDSINRHLEKTVWPWKYLFLELSKNHQKSGATYHFITEKTPRFPLKNRDLQKLIKNFLDLKQNMLVESENFSLGDILHQLKKGAPQILIALSKPIPQNTSSIATIFPAENYFCPQKFETFLKKPDFSNLESAFLIKCLLYLKETTHGLKFNLPLKREEKELFAEVCADQRCEACASNRCFYRNALKECAQKKIIIIPMSCLADPEFIHKNNHRTLIIADLESLEENLSAAMSQSWTLNDLENLFNSVSKDHPTFSEKLTELNNKSVILFGLIGIIFNKYHTHSNDYPTDLYITSQFATQKEWQNLIVALTQIETELQKIEVDGFDYLKLKEAIHTLKQTSESWGNNLLRIRFNENQELIILSKPLDLSAYFKKQLFETFPNYFLISSSLRSAKDPQERFQLIKENLNLLEQKLIEFYLPAKNTPKIPFYLQAENETVLTQILEKHLNTFIITNSIANCQYLHSELRLSAKQEGYTLLTQKLSGGFHKISDLFFHQPCQKVLIGNYDFFFDFAENLRHLKLSHKQIPILNTLIIHHLQFDHPDNPDFKLKALKYKNPFLEYSLKRCILKLNKAIYLFFAQGGQKIINLEPKLITKDFGKTIIENMPSYIDL